MSLAIRRNTFFNFFWCQQGNFRARRAKMVQKIDTFGQVDTRVLAILGVTKIVFWALSKLFLSCSRSVFFALKGLLVGVFSALEVVK